MNEAIRKIREVHKNNLNLNTVLENTISSLDSCSLELKEMTKNEKFKESYHLLRDLIDDCDKAMNDIKLKLDGDVELEEEFQLTDADEYFSR